LAFFNIAEKLRVDFVFVGEGLFYCLNCLVFGWFSGGKIETDIVGVRASCMSPVSAPRD